MTTRNPNPRRAGTQGFHPFRHGLITLLILAAVGALGGCEINKPEMPTFESSLTIPLGVERVEILEVIEDEDFLTIADDGGLSFNISGDPDSMAFDFDLSADIASQTIEQGIGNFDLEAIDPLNYSFELGQIWAPAAGQTNLMTIVPSFPIDVLSGPQDVPDVESAVLTAGDLSITLTNGLSVPVSAASGPDQLIMNLEDPGSGLVFAIFVFPEIGPGASSTQTSDLAGVTLPGSIRVSMAGGSAGSGGQVVLVNGTDSLDIEALFSNLVVSSAEAVVEAQSFQTSFDTELPADYELERAVISTGSMEVDLTNDLPMPCVAQITWSQLLTPSGEALSAWFNLTAGQSMTRTVDFSDCVLSSDGTPVTALRADVTINSPGSGTDSVNLASDDGLSISLAGGTISFSSVTGLVPAYTVPIDPIIEDIDLPEEMDGLQLVAASMVLHVANSAGLPADLDLLLSGISATGNVVNMGVDQRVLPAQTRAETTDIVLNESNSTIVEFLNNLPVSISLAGDVIVGGDGTVGTVHADDYAIISWDITAPVEVIITGTTLDSDPKSLDLDQDMRDVIGDHALGAYVQTEILNHMPVSVELFIKVGTDTTTLSTDPMLEIGPLTVNAGLVDAITHVVSQAVTSTPSILITADEAKVFSLAGLHTLIEVHLPSSNGSTVRMMSTDFLEVRGAIRLDVNVNDEW
jgi:hypothetical protein